MTASNTITVDATKQHVSSVCVFQTNRAQIEREISVELKAGQNEVVIENLPNVLDGDSIRVDGIGNAVIFDVIHSAPTPTWIYEQELQRKQESSQSKGNTPEHHQLREMERKLKDLESDRSILDGQSDLLSSYSNSLTAEHADADALSKFMELYVSKGKDVSTRKLDLEKEIEAVRKGIKKLKKKLEIRDDNKYRRTKITVIVLADKDGDASISLAYVVTDASWTPLYDLRARVSTASAKDPSTVAVQYRASISQKTYEDWNNVNLTLSTASPSHNSEIPVLSLYRIGQPIQKTFFRSAVRSGRSISAMAAPGAAPPPPAPITRMAADTLSFGGAPELLSASYSPPPMLVIPTAAAQEGATSTTFVIEGKSTIPSDTDEPQQEEDDEDNDDESPSTLKKSTGGGNDSHKVTIAVIDLNAKLEWVTVPRQKETTFLRCKIKNESAYIFLPGPSNVFLDNNFVCKSTVPSVSPQESFSTSLGMDPAIKVKYHELSKKVRHGAGGSIPGFSAKSDISTFVQRITIKNTRTQPITKLYIKDQIPVSEDTSIKVNLLEPRDLGQPKEKREIRIAETVMVRWSFVKQDDDDESEEGEGKIAEPSTGSSFIKKSSAVDGVEEEGVIEWVCTQVQPGKSLELALSYDVTTPAGVSWVRR